MQQSEGSVLSGEATNINLIVYSFTRSGLEPTIYRTRDEHANHYITNTLKSTCDVNLLSKLSIIFKEWRVIILCTFKVPQGANNLKLCTLDTIHIHFFVTRLIINKMNKVQWVYFKLENVLVSLHSLKTMGIGTFGALYEQGQIRSLSGLQTSKLN